MLIYRITRRYYYGVINPKDCNDYAEEYTATPELAHEYIKAILGEEAKCDDSFGIMEIWTTPHLPRIEYLVDAIRVLEK